MELDLLITETGNGGDLVVADNDFVTTSSIRNQVYLALFGGNLYSSVGDENNDYWANTVLPVENQFKSNFERVLMEVAINSSGIQQLESAANKDLEFLKKYVNYTLELSILKKDSLSLYVKIVFPNNVEEKVRLVWDNENKTIESWQ